MLTKIEHKFKNYFKQVTYKEVRAIENKTYKYIIRSYEPFIEEKAKTFIQAVSAI